MTLRKTDDKNSKLQLPGLNYSWQEAGKLPKYEWEQWVHLYEVAVLARHTNSIRTLIRKVDQQRPRVPAQTGTLEEETAEKEATSLLLYISKQEFFNGLRAIRLIFSRSFSLEKSRL